MRDTGLIQPDQVGLKNLSNHPNWMVQNSAKINNYRKKVSLLSNI
jgi:hypothetical protein